MTDSADTLHPNPTPIGVQTVIENTASGRRTLGEHGLSFWITTPSHRVLFDTGQNAETLRHNARQLDIPLDQADAVAISHGHYDHTGGLSEALACAPRADLVIHPRAFVPRYSRQADGRVIDVGMPADAALERLRATGREIRFSDTVTEIVPGLYATGEIPRETDFEDVGGDFYLDQDAQTPDPIVDDQAVFAMTPAGLVVVLGCAHAGVVNTLRHISRLTGETSVHAVIGGMHLLHANEDRLTRTIDALRSFNLQTLIPMHCTGARPAAMLYEAFGERWDTLPVGRMICFD
jgi:7,8-dihydropterin-6-yl-methyl-4-(beta-D-ribofuranosyl)aminobenzene 5'-phosphate synthase